MSKEYSVILRKRSGAITSKDPLVSFLYELMRDHIVPGRIALIMQNLHKEKGLIEYSNGYLAKYALDVAKELRFTKRKK